MRSFEPHHHHRYDLLGTEQFYEISSLTRCLPMLSFINEKKNQSLSAKIIELASRFLCSSSHRDGRTNAPSWSHCPLDATSDSGSY